MILFLFLMYLDEMGMLGYAKCFNLCTRVIIYCLLVDPLLRLRRRLLFDWFCSFPMSLAKWNRNSELQLVEMPG